MVALLQTRGTLGGMRVGLLVRNSTPQQIGNYSSLEQEDRLSRMIEREGGEIVVYDEQGTSGRDLAKRAVARTMLDDIATGQLHAIAAYDIKRLTRDEFGADAGTIAKRLARSRALLVTANRTYRLWDKDDKAIFRFEAAMSGRDVEDIRDTFWRGIFARAAREPFFMGKPALGYTTQIVEVAGVRPGERTRIKRVPLKDPAQADLMADLSRWFDECTVLGDVARRLTLKYDEALRARTRRGITYSGWRALNITDLLKNPVYTGRFIFGRRVKRDSVVWDVDERRERTEDFTIRVPELAYWSETQVRAWLRKFGGRPGAPTKRARNYDHALLGVLACPSCKRSLIGNGRYGYACSLKGTGKCSDPEAVSEKHSRQILRTTIPALFADGSWLAEAAQQELTSDDAPILRGLQSTLTLLEDKLESMTEEWYGPESVGTVPKPIRTKMVSLEQEIEDTKRRIVEEQAAQHDSSEMREVCALLRDDPVGVFDELDEHQQAAIYRLLLTDVQIKGEGWARGRSHRLLGYRSLLTNTWVSVDTSGSTFRSMAQP